MLINSNEVNIYTNKNGISKIKKLFKLAWPNSVKKVNDFLNIKYITNEKFEIEDYKINKVLVSHGKMKPAYGYIIEKGNIKIGFTGDTKINDNVEYMAKICRYLICDCSFIEGTEEHMGLNDIKKLVNKYPKCKFITSHMSDEVREELKTKEFDNIIIPSDGDEINVKENL